MLKKRLLIMICVICLSVAAGGCGRAPSDVSKDDPQSAALSAYKAILEAAPAMEGEHEELSDASFGYEHNWQTFGEHYDLFALSDLNRDGVPELIALTVVNFRWTPVAVYTFADGNAILLKDPLDPQCPFTFEQNSSANGAYAVYFCKENHIHSIWRGATPVGAMEEDHAYALEETALILQDCASGEEDTIIYFSDIAKENTAENRLAINALPD